MRYTLQTPVMKVVKQAPPRAPSALDVATKLASLAAPRPLVPALDQARRDATACMHIKPLASTTKEVVADARPEEPG